MNSHGELIPRFSVFPSGKDGSIQLHGMFYNLKAGELSKIA
ncbi:MAG: hypothetical protein Q4Q20_02470 [Methanocorpusculum sp.]|nr:hypothetical protein [Methanocorpusculum sp.]